MKDHTMEGRLRAESTSDDDGYAAGDDDSSSVSSSGSEGSVEADEAKKGLRRFKGILGDFRTVAERLEAGISADVELSDDDGYAAGDDDWKAAFIKQNQGVEGEKPSLATLLVVDDDNNLVEEEEVITVTADMLPYVIHGLNKEERQGGRPPLEIYTASNIDDVKEVARAMQDGRIELDTVSIVFTPSSHSTPIILQKDTESGGVMAINTDSVMLQEVDDKIIKDDLRSLSEIVPVYALGFSKGPSEYRRQYDEGSCVTFSMYDGMHAILTDFLKTERASLPSFVKNHSNLVEGNLYNLEALPGALMFISQSLRGNKEDGRRGLIDFIMHSPEVSSSPTPVPSPLADALKESATTLKEFVRALEDSGARNETAKKIKKRFFDVYRTYIGQEVQDCSCAALLERLPPVDEHIVPRMRGCVMVGDGSWIVPGELWPCISPITVPGTAPRRLEEEGMVTPPSYPVVRPIAQKPPPGKGKSIEIRNVVAVELGTRDGGAWQSVVSDRGTRRK